MILGDRLYGPAIRLAIGLLAFFWFSSSSGDTRQDLSALESKIQTLRQQMSNLDSKRESLENELAEIEKQTGNLTKKIRRLKDQSNQIKKRKQELEEKLAEEKAALAQLKSQLAKNIRAAYSLGRQEPLKLLLNQNQASSLSRMFTYYRYFNRARLAEIEQAKQHLNTFQTVTEKLAQEESHLQSVLEQLNREKATLDQLRKSRKIVLSKIKTKLKTRKARLAHLHRDKQNLEKIIQKSRQAARFLPPVDQGKPFRRLRGQLHWPVKGKLVAHFGNRRSSGSTWEGVVIQAPEGSPVRAIYPGRVIFADWLKGYGLLLIIKHDNQFMSIYAFNQSLMKTVGDTVAAGEIIATVGRSGGRASPGLYFAIRKGGKPVNPERWCKKAKRGRVS